MNNFNRRKFLKAAGLVMALPYLESFAAAKSSSPKRFVGIQMPFGFLRNKLYPQNPGSANSQYLKHLKPLAKSFTLYDGLYNPLVNGQHDSNDYFLTGSNKRLKVNSISVDQEMASHFLGQTRYKSISAGVSLRAGLSYTRSGIKIPVVNSPQKAFEYLFMGGKAKDIVRKKRDMAEGKSILDVMSFYSKNIEGKTSSADKEKMDQYFTAVRDVEKEIQMTEGWLDKPMPKVDRMQFPKSKIGEMENYALFMKIFKLALQTDSTRFLTYDFGQTRSVIKLDGVSEGYHGLSHHRMNGEKLEQMRVIEDKMFEIFGNFLKDLQGIKEGGRSLLDNTSIIFGSAMENPNNHSSVRPPIIIAGGGLEHKTFVKFDDKNKKPISNVSLQLLHKMGIEKESFGSSNGTIDL